MKVLVISSATFSKVYNTGKTYEQIFSEFKNEELCQLFISPRDNEFSDFDFCSSYYSVSSTDILNKFLGRSKECGREVQNKKLSNHKTFTKTYNQFKSINVKDRSLFHDILWKTGLWKTRPLNRWLKEQKPDLIFYVPAECSFTHEIVDWVAKMLNIPRAVYWTDDYFIHPIQKTIMQDIQHFRAKRFYPKYINKASLRFCIGERMAEEYSNFFGVTFYPIMNIVDKIPFSPKDIQVGAPPVISYLGGLHLNRWKMIARFAECIKDLALVKVYSASEITEEISDAFKSSSVVFSGKLTGPKEVQDAIQASDMVLHVESDDVEYRRYTYLSVSTKIPEYLISSRPTIGFGPAEVASMRILSDHNVGIVISSDEDNDKVRDTVYRLIKDVDFRRTLVEKAHKYVSENFNREKVAKNFRERLESLIQYNIT